MALISNILKQLRGFGAVYRGFAALRALKLLKKRQVGRLREEELFFFAQWTTLNYFHTRSWGGEWGGVRGAWFVLFLLTNQDSLAKERVVVFKFRKYGFESFFVEKEEYGGEEYSVLEEGCSAW